MFSQLNATFVHVARQFSLAGRAAPFVEPACQSLPGSPYAATTGWSPAPLSSLPSLDVAGGSPRRT